MMLSYKSAKNKVIEYFKSSEFNIQLYEPGIQSPYGWIFYYDQAGVFHPKLHEIEIKIKSLVAEGKNDIEILQALSKKEKKIYENSVGLVENTPIFIDKESGNISQHKPPTKAILHEIKEAKTNTTTQWKIKISYEENIIYKMKKLKDIYPELELQTLKTVQLIKQNNTLFIMKSIRKLIKLEQALNEVNLNYSISTITK